MAKSEGNTSSPVNFAKMFSALEIVLTVLPLRKTIEELIVLKFLRTSSVFLDKVTLLIM